MAQLTEMVLDAKSQALKTIYEGQLENLVWKIEAMDQPIQIANHKELYRTALDKAMMMLKSPYIIWEKADVAEKHNIYYFIFDQKMPFNQKEGYRTDKILSYASLSE